MKANSEMTASPADAVPKEPSVQEIALKFGCTVGQVKAQFKKNAAHIKSLIEKVRKCGKASEYTTADLPIMEKAMESYLRRAA